MIKKMMKKLSPRLPGARCLILALAASTFAASQATAQELSDTERKKRHYVTRMVDLIEMGKHNCQDAAATELTTVLARVRDANPDAFRLLEASVYFKPAKEKVFADEAKQKIDPANCQFSLELLKAFFDPEGMKELDKFRQVLEK